MQVQWSTNPLEAMAQLPVGLFVMTASFEDERAGIVVRSVLPCGTEPPLICVAARTGHRIEPLIRDSRCFAICQLDPHHKLALRKFDPDAPEERGDPFDAIPIESLATGSPVLRGAPLVFDCEVVRHYDLETDFELYVGQVLAARAARS
ncbi:MAG TPA: flavin reductase family protein [Phycisphaerales bacterium]|nr:flavin reductase family protein [Phycisphaerales bacterium]